MSKSSEGEPMIADGFDRTRCKAKVVGIGEFVIMH
jgi:hypothetical protein